MKRFEYKTVTLLFHEERELNQLGFDGWELVAVDRGTMYLKREISN
jgi:hypothetical protein